ncbi:MAG: peptidylprolyl isomerase [Phycisphaerae bacterium]|nr:peptidylprolyl isomerase [Phycisphaerae bacterium]
MRKFALLARFGALSLLLVYGCNSDSKPKYTDEELALIPAVQKEGLPEASGGFVLAVGDETITSDEIITEPVLNHFKPIAQKSNFEQFKKLAGPELEQIISTRVSNILLYQQAKREAGGGVDIEAALEKATEAETRSFVAGFDGDYAKAEQALKKMGMNWASFREYQKKMILSQDYIRRQLPERRPITRGELVNCYNEMKDEFFAQPTTITFRLIDIQLSNLDVTDPNVSRAEQARKLAQELMRRLQNGEDFGELAKQYSHGYMASAGGLWKPVQPGSLAKPYDVLEAEGEKIEPGQIAGPIEAGEHIFIMKLEEKKAKSFEPLENVQKEVESKIIFDRRKIASDRFSAELARKIAMSERDRFADFCLKKIYRLSSEQKSGQ